MGVGRIKAMTPLTPLQRDLLDFEQQWTGTPAAKVTAISARFGFSETRYVQILLSLVNHPEAVRHAPALLHRVARLDQSRRAAGVWPTHTGE